MKTFVAVFVVAALAASSFADLDASELKWLKQAVDALQSKSERVRGGGGAAIALLGPDVLPALLPETARLKTDESWDALAAALAQIGAKDAADRIDLARDKWPKGQEKRLGDLVARLRTPAAAKPAALPGKFSPEVDAKVRELLEPLRESHMYASDDLSVRKVVALGRAAVPSLAAMLRETGGGHGPGMLVMGVTDALAALAEDSDLPLLAQLLEEGHLTAAKAVARLRVPEALDALIASIDRGFVSYEFMEAIERFSSDPRVSESLVKWLKAHGAGGGYELGIVAKFLGAHRVAAAADVLVELLPRAAEAGVREPVGEALARLGRKEGIEALVGVMETGASSHDGYARHQAGEALNRIAGRRMYTGSFEPGAASNDNADVAAQLFRTWWIQVKDKLKFDETRRAWVVE